jgi:hypothetical protein
MLLRCREKRGRGCEKVGRLSQRGGRDLGEGRWLGIVGWNEIVVLGVLRLQTSNTIENRGKRGRR